MAGTKALRKLQLGRESTPGTGVAATTIWRGMGVISDNRAVEMVEEDIGILMGTHRSYIPKLEAALSMGSVPATFEQILHLLEAGLMTATPAQDGAGDGYIYTYNFPTTAVPTIKTYTIEGGDNQQAEEMEYSFVTSLTLEGNAGEALMMSAEWLGRQATDSTFTEALSVPSVEEILASKGKLYIDDVATGYGNTQVSDTLLSMTLNITTGLVAKYTMEGELYFSFHQSTKPEITLDLTFEHNSSAVTEKGNWRSNTPRAVQLLFEGSAFDTGGTTYSNKTLILNLPGVFTGWSSLGEQDGNDTYDVTLRVGYDETIGDAGQIIVVPELTTIP